MNTKTKIIAIIILSGLSLALAFYYPPIKASSPNEADIKADHLPISQIDHPKILKTNFNFNALGIKFENPERKQIDLYLKTSLNQKSWSHWQKIYLAAEDDRPDFDQNLETTYSELILIDEARYVELKGDISNLKNLELIYFDSSKGPKIKKENTLTKLLKIFGISSTSDESKIISRENWGADDSWRYCTGWDNEKDKCKSSDKNDPKWSLAYAGAEKIVIHHTASSQGDDDVAASVRAIYKWHAISRGWGDIGYNFLIDKDGNIYEGRAGGDGVVAGHAYGYNTGTIGIAFIGTYGAWINEGKKGEYKEKHPTETIKEEVQENGQWKVYVNNNISSKALKSLSNLIATKAREFEFLPEEMGNFRDLEDLPNIVGHRDVGSTHCPGDNLYENLEIVRSNSQKKFADLGGLNINYKARVVSQSDPEIRLKEDETTFLKIILKNEGETTWHNYSNNPVYLAPSEIKKKLASLDSFSIASVEEEKISTEENESSFTIPKGSYQLSQPNVAPGETVKVTFALRGEDIKGRETKNFVLAMGDKGWFSDTNVSFTIQVGEVDYAAELSSQTMPVAIFSESEHEVTVTYENIGALDWQQNEIRLNIIDTEKEKQRSQFKHEEWNSNLALIAPNEKTIKPGEEATFTFKIKGPGPGTYRQGFYLTRNIIPAGHPDIILGEEKITNTDFEILTRVDAPYSAKVITQEIPPAMLTTWRPTVKLEFENTGSATWKNVALVTYVENDELSPFLHNSWYGRYTIDKHPEAVAPGEKITFEFKLKAPSKPGEYEQIYELQLGKTILYINSNKQLIVKTRVD